MNIELKLNRDFENKLDELAKKYGEDFQYINGIHPSQLDFSEFLNKFVNTKTMADATIDPNANANYVDIRSFMTEKAKSEDKLFGLAKIYLEIKKMWGKRTADNWLEQEFSKGFYLNDAASASYYPYCFRGDTKFLTDEGIKTLKEKVNTPVKVLNKYGKWEEATVNYFGKAELRELTLTRHGKETKLYVTGNHHWLVKEGEELIQYETDFLVADMLIPNMKEGYAAIHGEIEDDWKVVSVVNTGIWDDVYCVSAPDTHTFTLDENILTGNCWANDLTKLATEGLFFLKGYNNQPPKHLETYFDDVIEFVSFLSNRQSGAVGLPNVLIWAYYFWKNDVNNGYYLKDPETYLRQVLQKFIFRLNQPFLRIDQCAFTNVSIFDRCYLESLFGGIIFPDGSMVIDEIEDIMKLQEVFMEVVSETREINMFTFPVLTFSCYYKDGKFQDEEFARWASKHNMKWSDSNFFVSDNIGVLSNCPVSGDTQVIYYLEEDEPITTSIEQLYTFLKENSIKSVKMWSNGKLINVKVNKFHSPVEYEISLANGLTLKTTAEHLNKVKDKEYVTTKDLVTGDLIPIGSLESKGSIVDWIPITEIKKISSESDVSYCVEVLDDEEPVFILANGIITHNCRLLSDTSKLNAFVNSIGGTALSIGSCRVSTINLTRIAYESELNEKKYLKILRDRVLLDCKALTSMRHILKRNIEKGLLPNYQEGAVELDKQYSTIGGLGLYEVMDLFGYINTDEFGNKSYSDEGIRFATEILDVINDVKDNFECDFSFNLEMIPAENCAGVICAADNLLFEQNKYFIYSNQWIPLMEKCTIQEKCRLGNLFDKKCGGGCIAHIDIESRFASEEQAWDMLNYVASQGVIYFAFTTKINVCEDRHAFIGTNECPVCGKPVADKFSRVVGFYTPVSSYQKIRKKEWSMRKWYDVLNKPEIM